MKVNILEVIINKPVNEVFNFTTDPQNTPKWIDSIAVERTNEWPPRVGTVYENKGSSNSWGRYIVSKYNAEKEFELVKQDDASGYHVNYTYFACSDGTTKLVYHEWVMNGEIDGPFTQDVLDNLKVVMERVIDCANDAKVSSYANHFLKQLDPTPVSVLTSKPSSSINMIKKK